MVEKAYITQYDCELRSLQYDNNADFGAMGGYIPVMIDSFSTFVLLRYAYDVYLLLIPYWLSSNK